MCGSATNATRRAAYFLIKEMLEQDRPGTP